MQRLLSGVAIATAAPWGHGSPRNRLASEGPAHGA